VRRMRFSSVVIPSLIFVALLGRATVFGTWRRAPSRAPARVRVFVAQFCRDFSQIPCDPSPETMKINSGPRAACVTRNWK
jgi:hypothetical protein